MLKPIRKPRPFAGTRGESLQDLYATTLGCVGVIAVTDVTTPTNVRYNTNAHVAVSTLDDKVTESKNVVYKRLSITEVFKRAKFEEETGMFAPVKTPLVHPLSKAAFISFLNGVHKCDFDITDIDVVYVSGSQYTVTALVDSHGYVGSATLTLGEGGNIVINCAGAPSEITIEYEIPNDEEPAIVEVVSNGVVISTGEFLSQAFHDALEDVGILATPVTSVK